MTAPKKCMYHKYHKTSDTFYFLATLLGTDKAIELMRRFQGEVITVTSKTCEFCEALLLLSDEDVLDEFFEVYEKMQLYIGKVDGIMRKARNQEIIEKFNGSNVNDLVREYGLTHVLINKIVKEKRDQMYKKTKK